MNLFHLGKGKVTTTFPQLFIDQLRDVYGSEPQVLHTLRTTGDAAHCPGMRSPFQHFLSQSNSWHSY